MGEYNDIQNALYEQLLTLQHRSRDISSVPELLELTEAMLDIATVIQDLDRPEPQKSQQDGYSARILCDDEEVLKDTEIPSSAVRFAQNVRGYVACPAYFNGSYCGAVYVAENGRPLKMMTIRSLLLMEMLMSMPAFTVKGLPPEARP